MKPRKNSIFIGSQKPISKVLGDRYIAQDVVGVIRGMRVGHAQETNISRTSAQALLAKLERRKIIEHNEYKVRSFREGSNTRVFIVHEAGRAREKSTVRRQAATVGVSVPSLQAVTNYIKNQADRRHSLTDIAEHFLGHQIDPRTDNAAYHRLRNLVAEAQALIIEQEGGKFIQEMVGHRKTYRWSKE